MKLFDVIDETSKSLKIMNLGKLFNRQRRVCFEQIGPLQKISLLRKDIYRHLSEELFKKSKDGEHFYELVKDFAFKRYGPKGLGFIQKLRQTSESDKLLALIVDPGAMFRLDQLLNFYKKNKQFYNETDCWQLREDFSLFLGKKTIYRALALTTSDLRNILYEGMQTLPLRKDKTLNHEMSLQEIYQNRMRGEGKDYDTLLSITEDPLVAIGVSNTYVRMHNQLVRMKKESEEKFLYLFELELPVIDIIYPTENDQIMNLKYDDDDNQQIPQTTVFYSESGTTLKPFSSETESFISYFITPSEMVKVYRVNAAGRINSWVTSMSESEARDHYLSR
jgi:hypothetical protein